MTRRVAASSIVQMTRMMVGPVVGMFDDDRLVQRSTLGAAEKRDGRCGYGRNGFTACRGAGGGVQPVEGFGRHAALRLPDTAERAANGVTAVVRVRLVTQSAFDDSARAVCSATAIGVSFSITRAAAR